MKNSVLYNGKLELNIINEVPVLMVFISLSVWWGGDSSDVRSCNYEGSPT